MRIEIDYNKEHHKNELEDFMNSSYKPGLSKTHKTTVAGIFILIIGILLINRNDNSNPFSGYVLIAFAGHFLIQAVNHYYFIHKAKIDYRGKIESDIIRMNQTDQKIIMEFNEDHFYYEEKDYTSKILWHMFSGFRIQNGYVYLDMNRGIQTTYIINKMSVGDSSFSTIIDILSKKVDRGISQQSSDNKKINAELIDN